jgi:ferritin-like metal-binding protein YciE
MLMLRQRPSRKGTRSARVRSDSINPAIDGIIKEAGEIDDKAAPDAAIVANAQAVEHYEMRR